MNVGSDYEVVTVSFNPKETWQLADAKKANYVEKYQRGGRQGRLAFPDRRGGRHQEPGRHGRIPLQLRSDHQAVRPRQRHHGADAGRQDRALLLRNRIQAARFPPGPGGSFGQQNRFAGRPGSAVLLSLRSDDRKIRNGHHPGHPSAWHGDCAWPGWLRVHHAPARTAFDRGAGRSA